MTQTTTRRRPTPPQGLAVVERHSDDGQGNTLQVKATVAGVVINGYPVNSNLVALLLVDSIEQKMRALMARPARAGQLAEES